MDGNYVCTCNTDKEGGACMAEIMVTIPLSTYDRLKEDSIILQRATEYQARSKYGDDVLNAILGIVKKDEKET